MSAVLSVNATAQQLALSKGPGRGVAAPTASAKLRMMSDSAILPIGAPAVVSATDYVRFMRIPKGAIVYPSLCLLSTDHSATIAGSLVFVPIDGVSAIQTIAGVTANQETTESTSVPDVAADLTIAADSWVQFVPAADLTIATTAKILRLRMTYGQTY